LSLRSGLGLSVESTQRGAGEKHQRNKQMFSHKKIDWVIISGPEESTGRLIG